VAVLNANLIEHSLELVVERFGDPGPLIYRRLFEQAPELEALFVRDADGSIRGEMLQRAFETLIDLAGQGHYGRGLIATEWVNHQNLGVPPQQFELFFRIIIDTIQQILGDQWSAEIDEAWATLSNRITEIIVRTAAKAAP
jgi:hemoglobin-like flavoprotein